MNRRRFTAALLVTPLGLATRSTNVTPSSNRQAPQTCGAEELPLLEVEMNDQGFVIPQPVGAGLTRMVVTNTGTLGESHLLVTRLHENITDDDFAIFMETNGEQGIDFEKDMTFLGAPDWPWPNSDAVSGVVEFQPGRHLILNIAEFESRPGIGDFVVKGEAPATCEPSADLMVTLSDMHIDLPDNLPAGQMTWKIENMGAIQHEMALLAVPDDFTVDDLMTLMTLPENATPPSGLPDLDYSPVAAIGVLSPQSRSWLNVNLEPGRYMGVCMLPFGTGFPHAMDGMVKIVTVA